MRKGLIGQRNASIRCSGDEHCICEGMCMKERYVATLVGCALGDTLGMPVEEWSREQIKKYVGRVTEPIAPFYIRDKQGTILKKDELGVLKYYGKFYERGEYTDDTIRTLALAESIAAVRGLDLVDAAKRQLAEYESRILPDGTVRGGFGKTTIEGFKNLQKGISPRESGVVGSPGNAPAMMMHPVGMYMHASGDYKGGLDFAIAVAKMTHLDPRSIVSGVIQAHAIYDLLKGTSRRGFVEGIVDVCKEYEVPLDSRFKLCEAGNLASRMEWIRDNMDVDRELAFRKLGCTGLVYESYPFALFMFQKYWDRPLEGLIETVNCGGDCDTTGAMYGALCGANNGMIFPDEWLVVAKGIDKLVIAAEKIHALNPK